MDMESVRTHYKNKVNQDIQDYKKFKLLDVKKVSDGYHTFDELYQHRAILFSVICNSNDNQNLAWKSLLHDDGTMFEGMFIVGIQTSLGDYTYHYDLKYWDMFDVETLERAPEWDGHKPEDITRLLSL